MNEDLQAAVIDKLTKTCTCKNINRMAVKKAIVSGCHTVEAVNKAVGTGSGACKGHGCGPRIQEILDDFLSK